MQLRTLFSAGAFAAALVGTPLTAQSVSFLEGDPYEADALTNYMTLGSHMTGMEVFWTFADGSGGAGVWGALNSDWHGVSGDDFRLRFRSDDDTFYKSWQLRSYKPLRSVTLRGALGSTVFDCTWYVDECYDKAGNPGGDGDGTEDSARGWNAQRTYGQTYGVKFIYSNMVAVGIGNQPLGDLFERVDIVFKVGKELVGTYKFKMDTDNSTFPYDPPTDVVPEPASMVLVATGLLGLAAAHRRRRKQA